MHACRGESGAGPVKGVPVRLPMLARIAVLVPRLRCLSRERLVAPAVGVHEIVRAKDGLEGAAHCRIVPNLQAAGHNDVAAARVHMGARSGAVEAAAGRRRGDLGVDMTSPAGALAWPPGSHSWDVSRARLWRDRIPGAA